MQLQQTMPWHNWFWRRGAKWRYCTQSGTMAHAWRYHYNGPVFDHFRHNKAIEFTYEDSAGIGMVGNGHTHGLK